METNYISKRLKLILPVFALLMLTSFLVNAQDRSTTAIFNNDIKIDGPEPFEFCDFIDDVLVEGTATEDVLDFEFGGEATTADVTIGWQYSTSTNGGWSSIFYDELTLPEGTLTPVNAHPTGPETIDGVEVTFAANAYVDLLVNGNWDFLRIRRNVAFTTDDPDVATDDASDPVVFQKIGDTFVCDDNEIDLADGIFEDYCDDEAEITLEGFEYGEVCYEVEGEVVTSTVSYEWWTLDGDGNPVPFEPAETGPNLTTTIDETTTFIREAYVTVEGQPTAVEDKCLSNAITINIWGEIAEKPMTGDFDLCIDPEANSVLGVYEVPYDDGVYSFSWQINNDYGTITTGQTASEASVLWDTESEMDSNAWVEVTVKLADNPDCQVVIREYVDISKQPVATIETEDKQELCLLYDELDDTGDYYFIGVLPLEATWSVAEPTKQQGEWTQIDFGGPEVTFVEPAAGLDWADINPFDTDTWVAVDDTKDYDFIIAVAIFEEDDLELNGCFDLSFKFRWTEFGKYSCEDDFDEITAIFYRPYIGAEFEATVAEGYDNLLCGCDVQLWGTPEIEYCIPDYNEFEPLHVTTGTWTVTSMPDGATIDDVTIVDENLYNTMVYVDVYGEYEFTWTVENGACGIWEDQVTVTFDPNLYVDAGEEQVICNNFTQSGNAAFTDLDAAVYYVPCPEGLIEDPYPFDYTGEWTVVSKPAGAGIPNFVDEYDPKTRVFVSSLGKYVLKYSAESENGICEDYGTVTLTFYPGLADTPEVDSGLFKWDADMEEYVFQPKEKVCSLAFDMPFEAAFDYANLSGPENIPAYSLNGEFNVYQSTWHAGNQEWYWAEYEDFTLENTDMANVSWSPVDGNMFEFTGDNMEDILGYVTVRTEDYGRFKVTFDVWVADKDGEMIDHPEWGSCDYHAETIIDLFWKPTAQLMPNNEPEQICGVEDRFITLEGIKPRGVFDGIDAWIADFGYGYINDWNQSEVDWYAMEYDEAAETWVAVAPGVVVFDASPYPEYNGRKVDIYANEQGVYRIYYEIYNRRGDCLDTDWQDVRFLVQPDAGDEFAFEAGAAYKYEFCGELLQPDDEDSCAGQGWNGVVEFHGFLEAENDNVDQDIIEGYWVIDVEEGTDDIIVGASVANHPEIGSIGYKWDATIPGYWTPRKQLPDNTWMRHDWIKFNGEYIFEVNEFTGAISWTDAWEEHKWDDNPDIEVSRHGVYEFHWKAYNPLALEGVDEECPPDYATHEVYFKNTPLARDLVPIRVVTIDGELTYIPMDEWVDEYEGLNHPFDDCYACSGSTQFYMLTRPLVEMKHGVAIDALHTLDAGMYSTVPKTHSILWYNKDGTGIIPGTSSFPQVIEGGTIDATYVLNQNDQLVSNVQQSNWNKHFIIEVTWEDVADPSQIRFEEENTVTDCKNQYTFDFTIVQPQVIAGPDQVPAFSHDITTVAPGEAHEYYLDDDINPIPGAVYNWSIDGDDLSYIIGGYVNGVWQLNTGDDQVMEAEGLDKIRVYWGAGLPPAPGINNPHGFVNAEIINSCHDPIDPYQVDIIENTLAGQLKYWNQEETFVPTPFLLHPNNIPDYFYVKMFEVNPITGNPVAGGYEEVVKIEPDTDLDLTAYFEFGNIDLTKSYRLKVWDGGFSYLEQPVTTDNFLSFTYTWNAWSHLGVSATDALALIRMAGGIVELNDLDSPNPYWWIGDKDDTPAYGFFSNALADVNTSGELDIVDVRDLMRRVVGDIGQFRNNTPNFQVVGRMLDAANLPAKTFGTGDEVTGFSFDNDEDLFFEFVRDGNVPYEGTTHPDDLYYKSNIFMLDGSTNLMNIYLAGMGDLNSRNSSVMGSGIAKEPTVAELDYTGEINAEAGDVITIPVRVADAADIAATTIGLTYNPQMIEVIETDYAIDNIDNKRGVVRVASVSTDNVFYNAGDEILNITVKLLGDMEKAELFELEYITEFASADMSVLDLILETDAVTASVPTGIEDLDAHDLAVNNYPNPFRTSTNIEYTLPESGKVTLVVYNRVGQIVASPVVEETQAAGRHIIEITSEDLGGSDGMFIYRVTVEGQTRTFVANGNLLLVK